MLPVSEAEALNIVVSSPCWKYGKAYMLSFKYLSMALRNKKDLDGIVFGVFSSFRLYFCVRMPCIDLLFDEFGFVLQLGKIVASIEQKPVSLNNILTCRTPIKNERDY